MNKFTYAAFSVMMGIFFFLMESLNFTTKFIAGTAALLFLMATMVKIIVVVSFREITGHLRVAGSDRYQVN